MKVGMIKTKSKERRSIQEIEEIT